MEKDNYIIINNVKYYITNSLNKDIKIIYKEING